MAISLSSNVTSSPDAFTGTVDDELILFDAERGVYFGAGAVGARVWTLIAREISIADICQVLLDEFDVERDVCEREVLNFIADLHQRGLVSTS